MTNFCREDLAQQLRRLRDGGRISAQTFRRWFGLANIGLNDFVQARGCYKLTECVQIFPLIKES